MENTNLRKTAIYSLSAIVILLLVGLLYYVSYSNQNLEAKVPEEEEDYIYVSELFDDNEDDTAPVVTTTELIKRPYNNTDIKIVQNYYDYQAEEQDQENSIIQYDTTYMQNNGIAYGGISDTFDVVSIAEGKVISIKDDNLLGKIVTIEHANNVQSIYQSLSEVTVKENDQVAQGTIIGKAGENNINKDLGNHVLLEISVSGVYVNPENCYDKAITDLKSN